MTASEIRDLLNTKAEYYEKEEFIASDPIQIPKLFTKKEDIEISAFITSTIAWGQRPMIIKKAKEYMQAMEMQPYEFLINASKKEFSHFGKIIYRTVQQDDSLFLINSLCNIYKNHGGLENLFSKHPYNIKDSIAFFREKFMETSHLKRSEKHIANPLKGSAAKRINMFLRWMVRSDEKGVDFGIWKKIPSSSLLIPLDTHSGRMARKYKLLKRKQNDWKALEELMISLRELDPDDPVKYDFALFGMGVFENKLT